MGGDTSLAVRLSGIDWSTGAKVGAMARADLSPGSPHVSMLFTSTTQGIKFSWVRREAADQSARLPVTGPTIVTVPDGWAKLERVGDEFIGWYSTDGTNWLELSRVTLVMPETLLWGMAATARDTGGTGIEIDATLCEVVLAGSGGGTKFVRGNANADGVLNITDGIFVLNFLFLGGPTPPCAEAANANGDAVLNITDGIYILNFLFLGGPPPAAPYPDCGEIAEADCAAFPPCNP